MLPTVSHEREHSSNKLWFAGIFLVAFILIFLLTVVVDFSPLFHSESKTSHKQDLHKHLHKHHSTVLQEENVELISKRKNHTIPLNTATTKFTIFPITTTKQKLSPSSSVRKVKREILQPISQSKEILATRVEFSTLKELYGYHVECVLRGMPTHHRQLLERHYNISLLTPQFLTEIHKIRNEWHFNSSFNSSNLLAPSFKRTCLEKVPECVLWLIPFLNTTAIPTNAVFRWCCTVHSSLKAILTTVTSMLIKSSGLLFFATYGSLLGIKRHDGVLSGWDTDIDLTFDWFHRRKIRDIVKILPKIKYAEFRFPTASIKIVAEHGAMLDIYWFGNPLLPTKVINGSQSVCRLYGQPVLCTKRWNQLLNSWYYNWDVFYGPMFMDHHGPDRRVKKWRSLRDLRSSVNFCNTSGELLQ